MADRSFGYIPDAHDSRDRKLGYVSSGGRPRPLRTHNLEKLRRTRFQTGNSCVGNSWAVVLQWFHAVHSGVDIELSAQHLYQHGLLSLPGSADRKVQPDNGCYPRDVASAGKKLGVALEKDWPSRRATLGCRVPPAIAATGMKFGGYDYYRVLLDQGAFLDALLGGPVQIGGTWWESWSHFVPGKAFAPPEAGEKVVGGHAVTAIDYDLMGPVPLVLVANQWQDWGFELPNPWHPNKPLASLAWFQLEALIPATGIGPRTYGIDGALTLRATSPGVHP